VAAYGLVAATLPRAAVSADAAGSASAVCLSMLFPGGKGKFDSDRYRDQHLPLIRGIYGDSVERIELRVAGGKAGRCRACQAVATPDQVIEADGGARGEGSKGGHGDRGGRAWNGLPGR